MKIRDSAKKITFLISLLHCILGNLIGAKADNLFIEIIFLPYSFIAGISNYFGWDLLSLVLEIVGLIVMNIIFYPIGLLLERTRK